MGTRPAKRETRVAAPRPRRGRISGSYSASRCRCSTRPIPGPRAAPAPGAATSTLRKVRASDARSRAKRRCRGCWCGAPCQARPPTRRSHPVASAHAPLDVPGGTADRGRRPLPAAVGAAPTVALGDEMGISRQRLQALANSSFFLIPTGRWQCLCEHSAGLRFVRRGAGPPAGAGRSIGR